MIRNTKKAVGLVLFILITTVNPAFSKVSSGPEIFNASASLITNLSNIERSSLTVSAEDQSSAAKNQTVTCRTFQLELGWNIFSLPFIPDSLDMLDVFQSLIDSGSLEKIQNEEGWSVEDWGTLGGWQNHIGNVSPTEGYKVKVNSNVSFELCGSPVTYPYLIPLNDGWNIIGYPNLTASDAIQVVQQLIDNGSLIKLQDEQGQSIEDFGIYGGWQNFIGNLSPGKGYKLKVSTADTLWIYSSDTIVETPKKPGEGFSVAENSTPLKQIVTPKASLHSKTNVHFKPVFDGNGIDHMNFNLVQLPLDMVESGDEIAVFDGEKCVGAIVINQQHLQNQIISIPTSSEDYTADNGFTENDNYNLLFWKTNSEKEYELMFTYISGAKTFVKNESVQLSLEKNALTDIMNYEQYNDINVLCYPNPFAEEVTIQINLPQTSQVNVTIFDQFGKQISQLANETIPNGIYKLKWNGKTSFGQHISSGIYYLQIKVDERSFHKKLLLQH